MMFLTKKKIASIVLLALTMTGCSSVFDFNKFGTQFTPAKQVIKTKIVKTNKSTVENPLSITISSDCSYVIRDLSVPNATDVWCIPQAFQ